jgi:ubiquinone/menaquinone biosynthesis C-methylase UbiE
MTATSTTPDLVAIKGRQQAAWSTGDYAVVGTTLSITGELLCEAIDLQAGERVLDVACGNGNAALAAARRFADVTGIDYVPALIERARERAGGERLPVTFQVGDAEALPVPDAAFDAVVSIFGVMFTPDQERAAAEMLRACRPGGRIGLVNWTPDSFIGQLFKTIARYVPPPAGLRSPMLWGTEERLRELFADGISALQTTRRQYVFRYRSAEHWLEVFRNYYGPMTRTFAALPAEGQAALTAELLDLARRHNCAGDRALAAPSDYLEVVAVRRAD